jgi:ArsR family transcriptional regulator
MISAMVRIKDPEQTARWFRALADETRLKILERLSEGEQCVCDLTDALESGQSLMSFHLKTLKDAGLIRDRKQGRWVYYALEPSMIETLDEWIGTLARAAKVTRPGLPCAD